MHTRILALFAVFAGVLMPGCEEKDPIDEALEEMEFGADTGAILIGDAEPEPEPVVRKTGDGDEGSRTSSSRRSGKTIDADDVVSVVKKKKGQVRSCYEKELKTEPDLSGVVQVGWTVEADGDVHGVRILSNSTGNRDMEGCIKRTIRSWSFPASHGDAVDIEYPFSFVPGG